MACKPSYRFRIKPVTVDLEHDTDTQKRIAIVVQIICHIYAIHTRRRQLSLHDLPDRLDDVGVGYTFHNTVI